MKKIFLLMVILLLSNMSFGEVIKSIGEINGGINLLAMTEYNKDAQEQNESFESLNASSDFRLITSGGLVSIAGAYIFDSPSGLWAFYVKNDYIIVLDNDSKVFWPNSTNELLTMKSNLSADYFGLGFRKYFQDKWKNEQVNFFLGFDAGIMYSIANQVEGNAYTATGDEMGTLSVTPFGLFFGTCFEAGTDYWFNDNFGLNFKAGYRYSKGDLEGIFRGTGYYYPQDGSLMVQPVDYSGLYINGGISFSFGGTKIKEVDGAVDNLTVDDTASIGTENISESQKLPELPSDNSEYTEFMKKGDIEFERKRYKIALVYFEQAALIQETADVYKRIGNCNFYLENKAEAKKAYTKSIELNPSDTQLINWLEKY